MGILQRIRTVLAANINALISKAEDPQKMLEQLVLDMQQQFMEARQQVAVAMADEKRLQKQYENEVRIAQEWENKAKKAILAGEEDLARQALLRKAEHDKYAAEFKAQWEAQSQAVSQLRQALSDLNAKIEEAKRKKNLLIARAKRAEAQKNIHDTMAGLKEGSAFDAFARMEAKVDQIEAEAQAATELSQGALAGGDDLERKFKELDKKVTTGDADIALLELKRKMGLLPSGSSIPAIDAPMDIDVEIGKK